MGEKWLMLNIGNEYICLIGIVWFEDISVENVILLEWIVNVEIQYVGVGDVVDIVCFGWLNCGMNVVSLL